MTPEALLQAALNLAKEGYEVFPLDADKKPKTAHGFHDATSDPDKIKRFSWSTAQAIGSTIPKGQIVIDIDPRNGGNETIKALHSVGRKLSPTKVHSTKNGGYHRWYHLPDGSREAKLKHSLGPGVDVKIPGKGYVVMPPSPGYVLTHDFKASQAPQWLLDEIIVPEKDHKESEPHPPKYMPFERGTAYGLKAMEAELEFLRNQPEGGRNNALNRAVFSLAQLVAGGEIDEENALIQLHEAAEYIGLPPQEIRQTIKSGWDAGLAQPRQAPEKQLDPKAGLAHEDPKPKDKGPVGYDAFLAKMQDGSHNEHYWLDWQVEESAPPFYMWPLIPKNAYVLVYGATEASKSMVWVALAAEASRKGLKCSVYSLENPSHIDRDRVRRLAPEPSNFRITNSYIDFFDDRQLMEIIEMNKAGGVGGWSDGTKTDLIVIDTYSHAFNSRSDDGNARAIEFARRVRYLMHEVGCTMILLDHTGYSQADEPRDASAKRQQVDVAYYMQKVGMWAPGTPAKFTITNKKSARFANPCVINGEIADVGPNRGLRVNWLPGGSNEKPRWEADEQSQSK